MIDTQAIRNKILDLAMRGKLSEQLPEDGTAEELYQQIQKEKQKLIKTGKIKKEKPLPEIAADEIPFEIPTNWKLCRFGAAITLVSGTDYAPEEYNDECRGTPYITGASNLLADGVLINRWTEKPRCLANCGDVLLVCKGSGYGKVAMCDIGEAHVARQIMAVKKSPFMEMRFILYFLMAKFNYLKEKGQGLIPGVDRKNVLNMLFLLPPLVEQQRIVARIEQAFSALDTIDALQAKYADNLAVLKSKLIDAAIQGKLTEQLPEDGTAEKLYQQIQAEKQALIKAGKIKKEKPLPEISAEEIPFEIPVNWKWVRLGDYCQKITDQVASGSFATLRENVVSLKTPNYAVMVKTADFSNGFTKNLTYTDKHGYDFLSNSNLFGGELILSNVGSVGKCFIVPQLPYKMTLAPNAVMVRMMQEAGKEYLYYFLISPQGFRELDAISTGVAVKKFNKTDLKQILIPLPPLAEQQRIIERIGKLLAVYNE